MDEVETNTGSDASVGSHNSKGAQSVEGFISRHAYNRHKFDDSRVLSTNRTQYGEGINVAEIRQETMKNPDNVVKHFDDNGVYYGTKYKKRFNRNISTSDAPTRESRVIINHLDGRKSTQFPLYKKGVTDGF